MRRIADQEDAQRLNREVALVSLLAELGHADLQVRRSVQTEGVVRVVLQHAGRVVLRGQAASAVDARLGPLLVLVGRVHLKETFIITSHLQKITTIRDIYF